MEWAIELGLKETDLEHDDQYKVSVWDKGGRLWDVDEADRLAKLAFTASELMTYDEQILWKLICETGHVWRGRHDKNGDWRWTPDATSLVHERLRQYWEVFNRVASGEAGHDILPNTSKQQPSDSDDLPF